MTGNEIVAMAHEHKCRPIVQPNGGLHIEGTDRRLDKLLGAFGKRGFYPCAYWHFACDGKKPRGFRPYIAIHPQVAQRRKR